MIRDQFESLEVSKKNAARKASGLSPEYGEAYTGNKTVGGFSGNYGNDSYRTHWKNTSSFMESSKDQSTNLSDISGHTESGIDLETVRKIIKQEASPEGYNQGDRVSYRYDNQSGTGHGGRNTTGAQKPATGFYKKIDKHGIENVHNEMHNHRSNSDQKTVLLCSVAGKGSSNVEDMWDSLEECSGTGLSYIVRNWEQRRKKLDYTVALIVNEHPLLSEYELLMLIRSSGFQYNQKINRGRLRRSLTRLKLSSGYERFRHYIKG